MNELEKRLRTLLSQAQSFVTAAPMEAVARAKLVVREGQAALDGADEATQAWLKPLVAYAESKVGKYEAALEAWQADNHARADLFSQNERDRYEAPVPGLTGLSAD